MAEMAAALARVSGKKLEHERSAHGVTWLTTIWAELIARGTHCEEIDHDPLLFAA